jgi:hypothetical protein
MICTIGSGVNTSASFRGKMFLLNYSGSGLPLITLSVQLPTYLHYLPKLRSKKFCFLPLFLCLYFIYKVRYRGTVRRKVFIYINILSFLSTLHHFYQSLPTFYITQQKESTKRFTYFLCRTTLKTQGKKLHHNFRLETTTVAQL